MLHCNNPEVGDLLVFEQHLLIFSTLLSCLAYISFLVDYTEKYDPFRVPYNKIVNSYVDNQYFHKEIASIS